MTKYILLLFVNIIYGQVKTIAIFDFQNDSLSNHELAIIMDRLQNHVNWDGDFMVFDYFDINEIIGKHKIKTKNCSGDCAIKTNQLLASIKILCGNIGRTNLTYTISSIVIDTPDSKIIESEEYPNFSGNNDNPVETVINSPSIDTTGTIDEDLIINLEKNINVKNEKKNRSGPSSGVPLATLWQLDALKSLGEKRGIHTGKFIEECYGISLFELTKSQGEEILIYLQYGDIPRNW